MDDSSDLDVEVRSFLRGKIASFEQLEALLLLWRRPGEAFSPGSVAEALRIADVVALEALEHLRGENLLDVRVSAEGMTFLYGPGSHALTRLVDQVAEAWDRNRLAVMNLMSSNAILRVRTHALRTFADAFLVGKKKDDDG
jgi:hypothetical protein